VTHRAELQLVLMTPPQVKVLPPGKFVAMGTSGLKEREQRYGTRRQTVGQAR
jgi:hypothetical protein